jgi:hypothetical protein
MKCPKCQTDNADTSRFCADCGTRLDLGEGIQVSPTKTLETPKEVLTTGSIFAGRYQVIEELGKGGMGKVYRVLDKKLNEEVALKLIKPEIVSDKRTLERFGNELKIAKHRPFFGMANSDLLWRSMPGCIRRIPNLCYIRWRTLCA